ncbi:uncharacterized protein LOC132716620 [Ruditapes philippinarum]|uniref:uncharacterized protein LOC132716620 n=1 Tax=Ruditapes philippinarum TaxID=129788 RepID=UPI00295AA1D2|nr:uncharacterized protein LOC132716620 [Ruditapes philippinarum]
MATKKQNDSKYHNWCKAGLAIFFTKEGIRPFVNKEIKLFQQKLLKDSKGNNKGTCSNCRTENVVECPTNGICKIKYGKKCSFHRNACTKFNESGCPKNICDTFYRELKKVHRFDGPSFRNTNAKQWCTNAWELAKCFMPPDGYDNVQSEDGTDFNGIISVILNFKEFDKKIQKRHIFEQAREIGKSIRHSPNFEIEDSDLSQYLTTLKSLLSDATCLSYDKIAQDAKRKLIQLENDDFFFESKDLRGVLVDAAKIIEQRRQKDVSDKRKEETEEQNLKLITDSIAAIKGQTEMSISEMEMRLSKFRDGISDDINKGIIKIENIVKESLQNIENKAEKKRESYDDLKKVFKDDLVKFNANQYSSIPLSPLCEEVTTPLMDFYVMPDMVTKLKKEVVPIKSLRDMFYKPNGNETYDEIYVTADAGFGKTAFSKRLVMTWCQAHQPDSKESNEDINTMSNFSFLFLVSLRNAEDECNIDGMIEKQILNSMCKPSTYTRTFLEEILSKEKCLVILDGLDEWMHTTPTTCLKPEKQVPHRNFRPNTAIVTTTRPWKLSVLKLKSNEVDNTVEIKGLNGELVRQLTRNAISKMSEEVGSKKDPIDTQIADFEETIEKTNVKKLREIPLLLLYMICLWYDEIDFGRSKSEFYVRVIEFLLARCQNLNNTEYSPDVNVPLCFKEQKYCQSHYQMLLNVSNLAFCNLFSPNRESTLVFDSTLAEKTLKDNFDITLKSGILTQSKEQKMTTCKRKVSFAHKSIQEFFAALFIYSKGENIVEFVRPVCKDIDDILQMKLVYSFLSGISLRFSEQLFRMIMDVAATDKRTKKYRRSSLIWDRRITQALEGIQNMFVDILNESCDIDTVCFLRLQDFFIGYECESHNYTNSLQKLLSVNKANIKTVSIKSNQNISNLHEILKKFELNETKGLEKVFYRNDTIGGEVNVLLEGSKDTLKYLTLNCHKWDNDVKCEWPNALFDQLGELKNLQGIAIEGFVIQHELLIKLLGYLKEESSLLEVSLYNLKCADSDHNIKGCCELDLSTNKNIKVLRLNCIPISDMKINVSSLRSCDVGKLNTVPSYLNYLEKADKLKTFLCSFQESEDDIESILEKLQAFSHLQIIQLRKMNVGEKVLKLPPKIKKMKLWNVTISVQALDKVRTDLENVDHPVCVEIDECTVLPDLKAFEDFKGIIRRQSTSFTVDCPNDKNSENSFVFTTKGKSICD